MEMLCTSPNHATQLRIAPSTSERQDFFAEDELDVVVAWPRRRLRVDEDGASVEVVADKVQRTVNAGSVNGNGYIQRPHRLGGVEGRRTHDVERPNAKDGLTHTERKGNMNNAIWSTDMQCAQPPIAGSVQEGDARHYGKLRNRHPLDDVRL